MSEPSGNKIDLGNSDSDPVASTLRLDDEDRTSHTIFAFELDAEDSEGDIEITDLDVTLSGLAGDGVTALTGTTLALLIKADKAEVMVDGTLVKSTASLDGLVLGFNFDEGDFIIEAGDTAEVEIEITFNRLAEANEGATIMASITPAAIAAEDENDDSIDADGVTSSSGETHTLRTEGLVFNSDYDDGNSDTADVGGLAYTFALNDSETVGADKGIFEITFEVSAFGDSADFYIAVLVDEDDGDAGIGIDNTGFFVQVFDLAGVATTSGVKSYISDSSADLIARSGKTDLYRVDANESDTFTIRVEVNPDSSDTFRVVLEGVSYNDAEAASDANTLRETAPEDKFRTGRRSID